MQSKTSFFNKAVFRKNFTRFAPVWGLYTLALLMGLFLLVDESRAYWFGYSLTELPAIMSLVNCGYALITAQLLFGDLYQSRSCYALHSMPLRRETWYLTNVISGLVFSLIPTAVMTLAAMAMMSGSFIVSGWQIPLYLFVGVNLQYIFFFGLATLCSFCAGNRLGMIVVYGVVNFVALGVLVMVQTLFVPMLFGVTFDADTYMYLCPVANMIDNAPLLEIENFIDLTNQWTHDDKAYELVLNFTLGDGWGYYFSCAATGLVFAAAGLLLYRRRHLESAGDLLAVKALEPVFQIVVTLACAAGFQILYVAFSGAPDAQYNGVMGVVNANAWYAFMVVGLVVGWFGGKMLLERSTTVFKKKNIPGLLVLAGVAAASLVLTALDPMGVVTRIPAPDEIESVAISEASHWSGITMDRPGDVEKLMKLHELALSDRITTKELEEKEYRYYDDFYLVYTLKNGKTVHRNYFIWMGTEASELLESFKTRPEMVMSDYDGTAIEPDQVLSIGFNGPNKNLRFTDQEDIQSLLDAVRADCEEGTMARGYVYHQGYFINEYEPDRLNGSVDFYVDMPHRGFYIDIYPESRHCLKWLEDHDPDDRLGYRRVDGDYWEAQEALEKKLKAQQG